MRSPAAIPAGAVNPGKFNISDAVFDNSPAGIIIMNADGEILTLNSAGEKLFGYKSAEVSGKCISLLVPDHAALNEKEIQTSLPGCAGNILGKSREFTGRNKDKVEFPVHISVGEFIAQGRKLLMGICHDTTEGYRAIERIRFLSNYDSLTGCMNRHHLHLQIERNLAIINGTGLQLVVVLINLDGMKAVNAAIGHSTGDKVLCELAERLKSHTRRDDLVARISGAEFVYLSVHPSSKIRPKVLARQLLKRLSEPVFVNDAEFHVQTSIGLSVHGCANNGQVPTPDEIISDASVAVYQSKNTDGSTQVFHPMMRENLEREQSLVEHLRKAIQDGAFQLHYQVQVSLKSDRIAGMEALLRWDDGENGMISPEVFIPLAEQSGLMPMINEWVLRRACADNKSLIESGLLDVPVAVNISASSFMRENFAEIVIHLIKGYSLPPNRLELEVTETVAFDDIARARNHIRALQAFGVMISIDDFGVGYSSPRTLLELPFNKLKIDRGFIDQVINDDKHQAIVKGYLLLADSMNIPVVAEGVEDQEQLEYLRAHGCGYGQGYYFSKPLPLDRLIHLIMSRQPVARTLVPSDSA